MVASRFALARRRRPSPPRSTHYRSPALMLRHSLRCETFCLITRLPCLSTPPRLTLNLRSYSCLPPAAPSSSSPFLRAFASTPRNLKPSSVPVQLGQSGGGAPAAGETGYFPPTLEESSRVPAPIVANQGSNQLSLETPRNGAGQSPFSPLQASSHGCWTRRRAEGSGRRINGALRPLAGRRAAL